MSRLVSLILFLLFSTTCFANNTFTVVNHFPTSLKFTINRNPELLPDLPIPFYLATDTSISSRVIDGEKHTYIEVDDNSQRKHYAFFGVESVHNVVIIHGYLSEGIAYSWDKDTITFCTPEDFLRKHKCE